MERVMLSLLSAHRRVPAGGRAGVGGRGTNTSAAGPQQKKKPENPGFRLSHPTQKNLPFYLIAP